MEILKNYLISWSPQKTQLIPFGKLPRSGKPKGTFDFLGFTFYRGKSLKGYWVIKKQTVRKRRNRFMRMLWHWCKENLHDPLREQHESLCSKLRGFYQYFGVWGNYKVFEMEWFDINPVTNTWGYDIPVLLNHKARLEVEGPLFKNGGTKWCQVRLLQMMRHHIRPPNVA